MQCSELESDGNTSMLMRRGHRLHSIAGAGLDTDMRRFTVVRSSDSKSVLESKLIDAVVTGDLEAIKQLRDETVISGLSSNQILMQDLVIEAVGLGNKEILLEIVDLLASDNLYAYEVIVVLCFLPPSLFCFLAATYITTLVLCTQSVGSTSQVGLSSQNFDLQN